MKRASRVPWWYGGSLLVVLFTLFPLYLMVKISVSPPSGNPRNVTDSGRMW